MSVRRGHEWERQHRRNTLAPSSLLVAIVGVSACTVFDGVTLPETNSSSTSSSSSSSSSDVSSSNTSSSSGESSSGTSSGSSTSSSSGAGGGQPASSTLYLSVKDATAVCSRAFTCQFLATSIAVSLGIPADDTNFSQCLTWLAAPVPTLPGAGSQKQILECVADAADCASAAACLPTQVIDPADPACSGGSKCIDAMTAADCAAHVLHHCGAPAFASQSSCTEAAGVAACTKQSCNMPGAASCSNGALSTCTTAGLMNARCQVAGLSCVPTGADSAECAGLSTCATPGISSCDGDIALACGDAQNAGYDCASIGEVCLSEVNGEARCDPQGAACAPSSPQANVCSANKKSINVCVGGKIVSASCPSGTKCMGPQGGKSAYCG